ncbi:hypothetical protein MMC19_000053 [Ptychographa xylographoides]|nr:hypothetical protein [Ptychographa xylographoides]
MIPVNASSANSSQLYTYPIKSLRGASLASSEVTKHGFPYDRRFMLLKVQPDNAAQPLRNMTVTYFPEMVLFSQNLHVDADEPSQGSIEVIYHYPNSKDCKSLEVPLIPDTAGLELIEVIMHSSPTKAFIMGSRFNEWFSDCFGYDVILVYLGPHLRAVLGNLSPSSSESQASEGGSWLSSLSKQIPFMGNAKTKLDDGITFADCAPYLVVTEESLQEVSSRLPEGEQMDVTKFRPNIVIAQSGSAYDEDFWAGVAIQSPDNDDGRSNDDINLELTQNCLRCVSINLDYQSGKVGAGESGKVLKKLMVDRRLDKGKKYSPIFGRYGFLQGDIRKAVIKVGDTVEVSKRNAERTSFCK